MSSIRAGAKVCSITAVLLLAACGETATLPVAEGTGANPKLPPPKSTALPTVHVAPATDWGDAMPTAAPGLRVNGFAQGLDHPRWLYVLPSGDVLVAETDSPPKPEDNKGIKAKIQKKVMQRAGSGRRPSANRISLLRDVDGDGVAETRSVFIQNLNSPFGMALIGDALYVANTDAVLRFAYTPGATEIREPGVKIADLPGGPRNHHWTKSLIASADGSKLYAGIGSNSNVAENGLAEEAGRAEVLEIDVASGATRVYASGLRNPVGLAWMADTLWVSVNERDEIGSDLVPDYITSLKDGAFYGWPWSYYGAHVDERVKPQNPEKVKTAIAPDYALGPHTASLGLAASRAGALTPAFDNGLFVGQHGSWNRRPFSGYKVIFVPFADGRPQSPPVDVLTGFLDQDENARGRPVGVAVANDGALLVADDVGDRIWRVSAPR